MEFGKNLLRLMKEKGLSLGKLEKLSGVSKPTLHGWTTGRGVTNLDQLKKVATVLEVPIHELIYGEPDPFESKTREVLKELFSGDVRLTVHRIERVKSK